MQVVAAVIERDDRILICQRRRDARHALKWEFPGGKVERGEDSLSALARELREELQIEARIGPGIHSGTVHYPNGPTVRLELYRVTEFSGEPVNLQFEQIVWEDRSNLIGYDFLEGDVEFVKKLAAGASRASNSQS
jgi:8-oxo-dGTP diphosphatase